MSQIITVNWRRTTLAELLENSTVATRVEVYNCPGLTALTDLPAATDVRVYNCPGLAALPALPAATDVRVENCHGLTVLPGLPVAIRVVAENCPCLTALPALPAATDVWVENCPSLAGYAGKDSRGYEFYGVRMRGIWHVVAGCRNLSIPDARKHWGPGGKSDRPDCAALVEKIAALVAP